MAQLAPVPDSPSVPPQNLEAEESVLGAMMISGRAIVACREILRSDGGEFYRESHARIWRAALTLADKGEPVDAITLIDRLEETGELEGIGGRGRLHELAHLVPATANVGHYARIVAETSELRDWIRQAGELARLGWERPGDIDQLRERVIGIADTLVNRHRATSDALEIETWTQFEHNSTETIPTLVDELWPEGALGFIAAPPKKGKTWVGLDLAIAVATGTAFLARFDVSAPQPVIYLALEGHRAAIRGRIGCMARGHGYNPKEPIPNLHVIYKPRGLNLSDPAWVRSVRDAVEHVGAKLVLVDVLRRAAVLKENDNQAFGEFLLSLDPIAATGCSIGVLHHFGKLTEITKDRSPGERMSGAGAMYGAFDVGVFITGSDDGARRLRIEFELRDLANPEQLGVHLTGDPTGKNGGFVFADTATWQIEEAPDEAEVKAPAREIFDWLSEQGGEADSSQIRMAFEITLPTLQKRERRLEDLGVEMERRRGKATIYRVVAGREDGEAEAAAHQQMLIDAISDAHTELASDPENGTPKDSPKGLSGSDVFRGQNPPDAGETPDEGPTTEHPRKEDAFGVGNRHMQALPTSIPRTSPTERQTPADAEPALREAAADDDIDWGLTE